MNIKRLWGMNYINMAAGVLFAALGLLMGRPVVFGLSMALVLLGFWSRKQWAKLASPQSVLWSQYIKNHPEAKKQKYISWHFGTNRETANRFANLVKKKKIRGVSYFVDNFPLEKASSPQLGDYSFILDWEGNAVCLVKTVEVVTVSFAGVTKELAALEGMSSVEEWKAKQRKIFEEICEKTGITFKEDARILFEKYQMCQSALAEI